MTGRIQSAQVVSLPYDFDSLLSDTPVPFLYCFVIIYLQLHLCVAFLWIICYYCVNGNLYKALFFGTLNKYRFKSCNTCGFYRKRGGIYHGR